MKVMFVWGAIALLLVLALVIGTRNRIKHVDKVAKNVD